MSEHNGFSSRTNRQLVNPRFSVIRNHTDDQDLKIKDSGLRIVLELDIGQMLPLPSPYVFYKRNQNLKLISL